MPNWCDNEIILEHDDAEMLLRAERAFNEGRMLQEFIPCPRPLVETDSVSYPKKPYDKAARVMAERQIALEAINMKHYGFKTWYDWRRANWGIKWDIGGEEHGVAKLVGNRLHLSFESPWGPPEKAYAKLEALGFKVEAYYYEEGMGFCGQYINGKEEYFNIPETREEIEAAIPEKLDDIFGISENYGLLRGE